MKTEIRRWGNSLALRIPSSFAREAEVREGSVVDLSVVGGELIVKPRADEYDLDDLLSSVSKENIHSEIATGYAVGREAW